jgi:type I restriction enzyme S subunit
MAEWSTVALNALAAPVKSAFSTGPFGSAVSAKNFRSDGIPMLRGSNLSEDVGIRLNDADLVYLSPDLASQFTRSTVRLGDLVFTCWGTVGQIGLIDDAARYSTYIVSNKQMKMTPDRDKVDPLFLYYNLSQPRMLDLVKSQAIGSSVPGFNLGQLRVLPVTLPSRSEQQAIAEVLGALDDKIAANTRLTGTIDEYLSTLFAGNVASCQDVAPLRDLAEINAESVKPSAGGSLRYIDIASVGIGRYDYPEASAWAEAPGRARRRVRKGDVLWSTVRPNRRSHALNLSDDPLLVGSTGLAVLTPSTVGFAYLYEVTRLPEFTAYLETVAEGSAYPAVRAERFGGASVRWLPRHDRETFEDIAAPMREHAHALESEGRKLAAMRDVLLPQLMSGRIRVRDAEQMMGDVV